MANTIYPYVDDEVFIKEVSEVLRKNKSALKKIDKDFHENVIDPFSALFDSENSNLSIKTWEKQEKSRQLQKTLQNAIGHFHQRILGSVNGWYDPGVGGGYDSEHKKRKIVAEIQSPRAGARGLIVG